MNEYHIGLSYRQINIHDNKRNNTRKAVTVDIATEIYTKFKPNRGNNITYQVTFIKYTLYHMNILITNMLSAVYRG